ncbi:MAG: hypothetical protein GVY13_12585 [Alphaproteobacteria bacterium]|nr:hypothetical protein [Alphaproteobacteria bacterium]
MTIASHDFGWFRRPDEAAAVVPTTIVVVGTERSGTTMVAQTLHRLGIFMGEGLGPTCEDADFYQAFYPDGAAVPRPDLARLIALARARDRDHARWGFKVPSALCVALFSSLREPLIIAIYRDPVAAARRLAQAQYLDPDKCLAYVMRVSASLQRRLHDLDVPQLVVSYEKALLEPGGFVDSLVATLGLVVTDEVRAQAIAGIQPSPEAYVEATRQARIFGTLDRAGTTVEGWVWDRLAPERRLTVEVRLDGTSIVSGPADRFRPDLKAAGYGDGCYGFCFALPTELVSRVGEISLHVSGETDVRFQHAFPGKTPES